MLGEFGRLAQLSQNATAQLQLGDPFKEAADLNESQWDEDEAGDVLNETSWDDDEDGEDEERENGFEMPLIALPAIGAAQNKLRGSWGCCSSFKGTFSPSTARLQYESCFPLTYYGRLICFGSMVPGNVGRLGVGSPLTYALSSGTGKSATGL